MLNWLTLFRVIALLEGLSYILLLFIAVPFKYFGDNPQYVKWLGMPHGILFIAYIIIALLIYKDLKWSNKTLFIVLIAAIIPFGTFYVDYHYLKAKNGKS